jgi:Protein of unknown function (DUF2878)
LLETQMLNASRIRGPITWLAFNVVWFACAAGAANGSNAIGVASASAFVVASLWATNWPRADVTVVLLSAVAGLLLETALVHLGVIRHNVPLWAGGAPPWIVALWLAFGATIPTTAAVLGSHSSAKAALLGFIFGPVAYVGGEALGALAINGTPWRAHATIAALWALAFPALVKLYTEMARR